MLILDNQKRGLWRKGWCLLGRYSEGLETHERKVICGKLG